MSDSDEHPIVYLAKFLLGAAIVMLYGFGLQSFQSAVVILLFFIMMEDIE